ncbi:MAG: hypothetical protein IPO86_04800 [Saprospiraceae bacterium]|nr:hypothetical protein [Saprospiraceae bacterium]MBK9727422.1 hypothetical protein [Saprospiraceae bacterium]
MKLSGFTFMRNTSSLYYPFLESIQSILPMVDEFVIAIGDNAPGDQTENLLQTLQSDKIKLIHTIWDLEKFKKGTVYAQQTDLAKAACTGDWLFYLQSDELIHEQYHKTLTNVCLQYLEDLETEGFLFRYKHFWGDYDHFVESHAWYPAEIRLIRNDPTIHSFGDAQSFRKFKHFDGLNYRDKINSKPLKVRRIDAEVYHYGWVRPPSMMQQKTVVMDGAYHDSEEVKRRHLKRSLDFDYGNMNDYSLFKGTHPHVMKDFMNRFNWKEQLHYDKNYKAGRLPLKHEKIKYRILSFVEKNILGGRQIFGYRNWSILD